MELALPINNPYESALTLLIIDIAPIVVNEPITFPVEVPMFTAPAFTSIARHGVALEVV